MYAKLDRMIDLIHHSLARRDSSGSEDHALMIYGGDYAKDGTPLSLLDQGLAGTFNLPHRRREYP